MSALKNWKQRSPESLAVFIGSLAHDAGPIGEQIRTFLIADNLPATVKSIRTRIDALGRDRHGHGNGATLGEHMAFIVDAIDTWVRPVDARSAFALLAALYERNGDAMEQCGDHHDTVMTALHRATDVMMHVAPALLPMPSMEGVRCGGLTVPLTAMPQPHDKNANLFIANLADDGAVANAVFSELAERVTFAGGADRALNPPRRAHVPASSA